MLDYQIIKRKLSPFISCGFIIGKIIKNDSHYYYKDGTIVLNNYDAGYDIKYPYYFTVSAGLLFEITDNYSFRFEPCFIDCLKNNYPVGPDSLSKMSFGARFGISFNFNITPNKK